MSTPLLFSFYSVFLITIFCQFRHAELILERGIELIQSNPNFIKEKSKHKKQHHNNPSNALVYNLRCFIYRFLPRRRVLFRCMRATAIRLGPVFLANDQTLVPLVRQSNEDAGCLP